MLNGEQCMRITLFKYILLVICIGFVPIFSQERIAVLNLVYPGSEYSSSLERAYMVSDRIRNEIIKYGDYEVVERDQLNRVIEEQKLQLTGIIDENTAVKVGKILGANYVVIGTYYDKYSSECSLNIRLVEVESGKAISAGSVDEDTYSEMMENGVSNAVTQMLGYNDNSEDDVSSLDEEDLQNNKVVRTSSRFRDILIGDATIIYCGLETSFGHLIFGVDREIWIPGTPIYFGYGTDILLNLSDIDYDNSVGVPIFFNLSATIAPFNARNRPYYDGPYLRYQYSLGHYQPDYYWRSEHYQGKPIGKNSFSIGSDMNIIWYWEVLYTKDTSYNYTKYSENLYLFGELVNNNDAVIIEEKETDWNLLFTFGVRFPNY